MRISIERVLCLLALFSAFDSSVIASPLSNRLLPLVPAGAEIVAGFENYPDPHRHGQLLLTPHNDRLDLADWQGIAGVDPKRSYQEFIEVASSGAQPGMLTEHLLLVAGSFNRECLFKAAELNGAERRQFENEPVMVIGPFDREKGEMPDTRWLVILEDRIALFGTPLLVQRALSRYTTHADVDVALMERLSQLRSDASSWNVIISAPKVGVWSASPWGRLLEDSEVLMVAARFGEKVRVDFSVHADAKRGMEFFRHKAACFMEAFRGEMPRELKKWRAGDVQFEQNRVLGSIEMSKQQFEMWSEQASLRKSFQPSEQRTAARGE